MAATVTSHRLPISELNRVRSRRSALKRRLAAGEPVFEEFFAEESMRVIDALKAIPYVADVRAKRLLYGCDIRIDRRFGDLTPRQRGRLRQAVFELRGVS